MKTILKEFLHACWELLKLPFALIEAAYHRIHELGWHKLAIVGVAAVVLALLSMTLLLEVTSQSKFCGSCHLMRPYIAAWEESSHKDVECMHCHAREGVTGYLETKFTAASMVANYFTGIYKRSKPWAEIEDKNCLVCHESRLLEGRIEFKNGIIFDHTPHLTEERRGRKLRCTSCHSQIVQGDHISVTTMTCFLCHFKNVDQEHRSNLKECTICHEPPTGIEAREKGLFDHTHMIDQGITCQSCHQQMWQGTGEVRRERCGSCHSQVAHIDRIDDLEFVHEWHIEKRKVECQRCHDAIIHRQPVLDRDIRSNCDECHIKEHSRITQFYQGLGATLIEEAEPDTMFQMGVLCFSCHKEAMADGRFKGKVAADACIPCHEESYRRLATDWRFGFDVRVRQLETALKSAGSHPKLEAAKKDLLLVKESGAWHNPKYAEALITDITSILNDAGAHLPSHPAIPSASKYCLNCHSSIAELPVKLHFSDFDHSAHLSTRGVACTQCHIKVPPTDKRHGQRVKSPESCTECHHNSESFTGSSCDPCHIPSRDLYFGKLPNVDEDPSPMAASDMGCLDCHEEPGFSPPQNDYCLNCHDEDIIVGLEVTRGELKVAMQGARGVRSLAAKSVKLDNGRSVHHPDLAKKILLAK